MTLNWEERAKANIEKKVGIFVPRDSKNMKKSKWIDKAWLKRMIEAEGYGK